MSDWHEYRESPFGQGQLFDIDSIEDINRVNLAQERLRSSNVHMQVLRFNTVINSTIPITHLQSRLNVRGNTKLDYGYERPDTVLKESKPGGGHYQAEETSYKSAGRDASGKLIHVTSLTPDVVASPANAPSTLIHEMGHRHHFSQYPHPSAAGLQSPLKQRADPVMEGHADAYVDRYFPQSRDSLKTRQIQNQDKDPYWGLQNSGYSTNFQGDTHRGPAWSPAASALYAATRAHFGATGEIVPYVSTPVRNMRRGIGGTEYKTTQPQRAKQEIGYQQSATTEDMKGGKWRTKTDRKLLDTDPTIDATLHFMVEHSPHARQAVAQTTRSEYKRQKIDLPPGTWSNYKTEQVKVGEIPLAQAADEASRRHMDRQLLRQGQYVQESLFGEPHMARNQFGELPRTVADVKKSLRIKKDADFTGTGLL